MKRFPAVVFTLFIYISSFAQSPDSLSGTEQKVYIPQKWDLELFSGIDLNYKDVLLSSQYQFLINLTPAVKFHMGHHILFTAQALIPIINDYGDHYKNPRLNILTVSQEYRLGNFALKPTIGLFSNERWGVDLKAMYPVANWLAFEAQASLTGYLSMAEKWQMSKMQRIMALGGADVYLPKWNTQFRMIGGRFIGEDYGAYAEGMRHFKHCTIGVYGEYSSASTRSNGFNGGFRVTMIIPPYKRRHHRVTVRPANNFLFSYNMNADAQCNKTYITDPEQNSRHGWFSPDILPWGANLIYDYKEKEVKK